MIGWGFIGWIIMGAAIVVMFKAAELEHRNGWAWAGITFLCCLVSTTLMPNLIIVNAFLGLVLSFALMTTANILRDQKRRG